MKKQLKKLVLILCASAFLFNCSKTEEPKPSVDLTVNLVGTYNGSLVTSATNTGSNLTSATPTTESVKVTKVSDNSIQVAPATATGSSSSFVIDVSGSSSAPTLSIKTYSVGSTTVSGVGAPSYDAGSKTLKYKLYFTNVNNDPTMVANEDFSGRKL